MCSWASRFSAFVSSWHLRANHHKYTKPLYNVSSDQLPTSVDTVHSVRIVVFAASLDQLCQSQVAWSPKFTTGLAVPPFWISSQCLLRQRLSLAVPLIASACAGLSPVHVCPGACGAMRLFGSSYQRFSQQMCRTGALSGPRL
jgi:hypothetical protein